MRKCLKNSIWIIISILKCLLFELLLGTILLTVKFYNKIDLATVILLLTNIICIVAFYKLIKSEKIKITHKVLIILLVGIILRILWLININTLPYSDFETLYTAAVNLTNGNNDAFTGVNYIARFPHLSYMIVYMAMIIKIFGEGLIAIKIGNLIFSVITMYLVYKISLEVFDSENLALVSLSISALFAPMVTYVGVLATENIAIPLYLASIYFFILYVKEKISVNKLIICGICIGIGNLFRMVGVIMVVAYILYIFIFTNKNIVSKIKASLFIIVTFYLVLFAGSGLLKTLNITEVNLWKGTEPKSTNILKGTNIESFGRFNEEDATLPEKYNWDYEKVDAASKAIIKERLTTTPPLRLGVFYAGKFVGQWVQGDMSGVSWSETGAEDIKFVMSANAKVVFQLVYVGLIILCLASLFNKKRIYGDDLLMNLFYMILCGYGISYLVTEMQGRYAYILCWLFIILATSGVEKLYKKIVLN